MVVLIQLFLLDLKSPADSSTKGLFGVKNELERQSEVKANIDQIGRGGKEFRSNRIDRK